MNSNNDMEKLFTELSSNLNDEELLLAVLQGLISAEIAMKRQELGMSQKEFAEMMGVSQGLVSRWEKGDTNFTLSTLVSIAIKLGIDMQSPFVPSSPKRIDGSRDNIVAFPKLAMTE